MARALTLAAGIGSTYGSGSYRESSFGVTPADSLASGLRAYDAGPGLRDLRGWLVVLAT